MPERPHTLLVVDDEPLNVKLLKARFTHVGYSVLEALSGEEALKKAELQPDLILLDVMMPGINGFDTCRCLKEDPRTSDIPVIFLSAVNDAIIKVNGLELGGVDYIAKPFDAAELLARVRTHIRLRDQERQLAEYAGRLEQRVEERTAQLVHADRLATLGTFSAAVVHEINTPLTYIGGNVDLLQADFEAAKPILQRHLAEDETGGVARLLGRADKSHAAITEGLERIVRIVTTLKTYSAGGSPHGGSCRLLDAVEDAVRLLGHRLKSGARIRTSIPADIRIPSDRQKMGQVFVNLFGNSLDAIGAVDGEIDVSAENGTDRVLIHVRDTGPGIPPDSAKHIFDPFFTTKTRGRGTGLGLFIVRSIIEECGGSVALAHSSGRGAAFRIELPTHGNADNSL
ncbi:MAG: response regulator [Syntrophobacteraceae bacterium]